jgi:rubrerythrin
VEDEVQTLTVLEAMEKIEDALAQVYEWLARLYAGDEEAAGFFARLSQDEIGHRNLVRYERRLVESAPDEFGESIDVPVEAFNETVRSVHDFCARRPTPTLTQALVFAMTVEASVAENLHRDAIITSSPDLQALIRSLGKADEAHRQELETFLNRRRELFDTG